jgi:isoquinoline 1-oxidoreductase subunit beta
MARGDEQGGITRRRLLIGGGAGVGLVVAWALWPRDYRPNLTAGAGETLFNAFLKIGRDGRVIAAVPQAEAGQGVYTALPQIVADELGADWRTVSVEPAPLSPLYANVFLAEEAAAGSAFPETFGIDRWAARQYAMRNAVMLTGGSSSVRGFEAVLREAAAGARALLMQAAAARWGANWEELDTRAGFVVRGGDRIAFAELAAEAAALELPSVVPMRGGNENRLVGQPLPRLDTPAKLDGSAMFAGDVRLRDMCFVAVRTAPPGGALEGVDWDGADTVPGAFRVVQNPGFVAVAAVNGWAAMTSLARLSPRFTVPGERPTTRSVNAALAAALDGGEAVRLHTAGDPDNDPDGASRIEGRYAIGPGPSAPIEPLTATARFADGRLEVWAPTMALGLARSAAARAIDIAEGMVTIYPTLVGGGYGRKLEVEAIQQAAIIAQALGQPAQIVWPRIQEIRADAMAPPAVARMSATVAGGRIHSWRARIASPDAAAATAERLNAAHSFFRPDGGVGAGAVPPYGIGHLAVDHVAADIGIPVGIGRGGAHVASCFFTESFVDDVARAAGQEPLSYRMAMLADHPRLARCLATATAIGGWDGGVSGGGMGIAVHQAFGSYVAGLVEVAAGESGRLRALRAVLAVDCGRVINPDLVKQQIEGGFIHGLLYALGNPVEIEGGVPTFGSIGDYGLPILRDAPDVTVELVESDEASGGVTELAVPVAAPAVANAYYALSGRRVRALPIRSGR